MTGILLTIVPVVDDRSHGDATFKHVRRVAHGVGGRVPAVRLGEEYNKIYKSTGHQQFY